MMKTYTQTAVLFLHAFPLNRKMFQFQFEAFEKEGIPYVAVDYPGFGENPPVPYEYSLTQLTDFIAFRLNELGIKKVIPIGDSMGGYIMFELWRHYPEIISGFIFTATRAEADTEEAKKVRFATIERIKNEGKEFLIEAMLEAQTSPETKKDTKKMELLKCIMNEATEEGIIGALKALASREDNTQLLSTINVPTLVIAGADDEKVTPPEIVKPISDGIKDSIFTIIPKSAHLPPFENPEEYNKIIIPFIKEIIG